MTILRLSSVQDPRLDLYRSLTNHQLRNALDPSQGIVIVESQIAIRAALSQGVEPLSFLLDERRLDAMSDVLAQVDEDVPVFVLPPEEAEKLTGYRVTRGALCAMRRPAPTNPQEFLEATAKLVVLEGITDTSNVGALFRNAAALGADAVAVAPTCADPLSRRAVRVSMGNVFFLPWFRVGGTWPHDFMDQLEEAGFHRLALALAPDAQDIRTVARECAGKKALFFGSEGAGLTAQVLSRCDQKVVIPMSHGVDSLNVAASSAVAMWELFR